MSIYTSANPIPVDRPFAKLLQGRQGLADIAGIPPVSQGSYHSDKLETYLRAAAILGLDSADSRQVARRVRHLNYILRSSRFSDRISWRSGLGALDSLAPIFDEPEGLVDVEGAVSGLNVRLVLGGSVDPDRSSWRISISGTSPNLQLRVDGVAVGSPFSTSTPLPATPVPGSGRSIVASSSVSTVSWSAELRIPYSGDFSGILARVHANKDFLLRMQPAQEYLDAVAGDIAEDAVAAFILSVDSF
jgi:hypothetical protein